MTPAEPNRDTSMRVSDAEREAVAELLRQAHAEGRLTYAEFAERLDTAYAARTRGELVPVTQDLPQQAWRPALAPKERPQPAGRTDSIPVALRGAWWAWAVAVSVNVVIWLIVSVSSGDLTYFWPAWVAGPWGAVLLMATLFGRGQHERGPRTPERRPDRRDGRDR